MRWLERLAPSRGGRVRIGIGDDAALVRVTPGRELVLSTDLSIEGVHFRSALHPPRSVGHRALARSLSDMAAMGAIPRFALVSLAISKRTRRAWVEAFYMGLLALARRFNVAVIGGDSAVVSGATTVDVVVAGEVERGRGLPRSGARPGDHIFISGRLGLSALGLKLLRRATPSAVSQESPRRRLAPQAKEAIQAHLYPMPLCALGRYLSKRRFASALIDVSDGLSTDLARLCEASGVGARLWADRIPKPGVAVGSSERTALRLALHGGEDYQLLFTVPPAQMSKIPRQLRRVPLNRIGEVRSSRGLLLIDKSGKQRPLEPAGYDHFRGK